MKRSRHYGDVNKWIEQVIESSTEHIHLKTCLKLVRNFERIYPRENNWKQEVIRLGQNLQMKLSLKSKQLIASHESK